METEIKTHTIKRKDHPSELKNASEGIMTRKLNSKNDRSWKLMCNNAERSGRVEENNYWPEVEEGGNGKEDLLKR